MKKITLITLSFLLANNLLIGASIRWTGSASSNGLYDKSNWIDETTGSALQSISSGVALNKDVNINSGFSIGNGTDIKGELNAGSGSVTLTKCNLRMDYVSMTKISTAKELILDSAMLFTGSVSAPLITLRGKSELHLHDDADPILSTTKIDLTSDDAWVFFLTINPNKIKQYLANITVNGVPAVAGTNVRVNNYYGGTVIIPHSPKFYALSMFANENYTGTEKKFYGDGSKKVGTTLIGIQKSLKLKRGYMATITDNPSGTGNSKIYFADDSDISVSLTLNGIDSKVMYLRVLPIQWILKKGVGWGSNVNEHNVTWYYNWSTSANSVSTNTSNTQQYVGMRHGKSWPSLDGLSLLPYVNHLLGFNEPERTDQANMTVAEALSQWPTLQGVGTYLGSPVPANSSAGKAWLIAFMDSCIARNYRVDFIALHNYEKYDANTFVNSWCKFWYDKYKIPIWVTEWNYGAQWNSTADGNPETYHQGFKNYVAALDAAPFIQRYALFPFGNPTNKRDSLFCTFDTYSPPTLSRNGIWYREQESRPERGNPILYRKQIIDSRTSAAPTPAAGYDGKCMAIVSKSTDANSKRRNLSVSTVSLNTNFAVVGSAMGSANVSNENFRFVEVSENRYRILAANNCKALAAWNDSVRVEDASDNSDRQIWEVLPGEIYNTFVTIKNMATQNYLIPFNSSFSDGNILTMLPFTAAGLKMKAQAHWELKELTTCGCVTDPNIFDITVEPRKGKAPLTVNVDGGKYTNGAKSAYYLWKTALSGTQTIVSTKYNDQITFQNPGKYDITVLARDFSSYSLNYTYTIEVEAQTGINDLKQINGVRLYPNPVLDQLYIDGLVVNDQIAIYNLQGVRMLSSYYTGNSMNVSNLNKGLYLLTVNGFSIAKFIKK